MVAAAGGRAMSGKSPLTMPAIVSLLKGGAGVANNAADHACFDFESRVVRPDSAERGPACVSRYLEPVPKELCFDSAISGGAWPHARALEGSLKGRRNTQYPVSFSVLPHCLPSRVSAVH